MLTTTGYLGEDMLKAIRHFYGRDKIDPIKKLAHISSEIVSKEVFEDLGKVMATLGEEEFEYAGELAGWLQE